MGNLHISRPDAFSSVLGFHHLNGNSRLRSKEVVECQLCFHPSVLLTNPCNLNKKLNKVIDSDLTEEEGSKTQRCKNQRREPLWSVSIKRLDRVVGDQGKAQRFKGTEEHCRQDSQTASADFFFCTKKTSIFIRYET